jgi:hypothetical protein
VVPITEVVFWPRGGNCPGVLGDATMTDITVTSAVGNTNNVPMPKARHGYVYGGKMAA